MKKLKTIFAEFNKQTTLADCTGQTITVISDGIKGDAFVESHLTGGVFKCLCLRTKVYLNLDLKQLLEKGQVFVKRGFPHLNVTV